VVIPPNRATSSVIALAPTDLLLIDGMALRAALDADAVLAAAVYRSLLEALANRLRGTRMQLLDLFSRPADEPW
jgi:CRP-like cAMP-binding protein